MAARPTGSNPVPIVWSSRSVAQDAAPSRRRPQVRILPGLFWPVHLAVRILGFQPKHTSPNLVRVIFPAVPLGSGRRQDPVGRHCREGAATSGQPNLLSGADPGGPQGLILRGQAPLSSSGPACTCLSVRRGGPRKNPGVVLHPKEGWARLVATSLPAIGLIPRRWGQGPLHPEGSIPSKPKCSAGANGGVVGQHAHVSTGLIAGKAERRGIEAHSPGLQGQDHIVQSGQYTRCVLETGFKSRRSGPYGPKVYRMHTDWELSGRQERFDSS